MEHKGHTIHVSAQKDSHGKCCDANYAIHRIGELESIFAGVLVGIFESIEAAEAAALAKAQKWIDEQPAA